MNGSRRLLTVAEREEIALGVASGVSGEQIAARIGRCPSVVCREIARHGGRAGYRGHRAQDRAVTARCRPKVRRLDADERLRERVLDRMRVSWSPGQIAAELKRQAATGQAGMMPTVSHQAIYDWIYARPKGELRALAARQITLRSGRTRRRGRRLNPAQKARIVGMTSIEQRPDEVAHRRVPGHWEGDLLIGKAGRTAMGTLVERTSRFLIPVALPLGKDSGGLKDALIDAVTDLPAWLRKTLTWDCGTEMAQHAALTVATNVKVYFAHPHSPWERGTNENTNRWLREYFPKGTDIPTDPAYLWSVAREINGRPRQILDWRKPTEVFTELLTSKIAYTE
ncbi:MAG: IS30 family transposase [Acidimicrobiales bacterium]|nr:MAG: IS30 family transposase [Acidimicrobiales bacterium]